MNNTPPVLGHQQLESIEALTKNEELWEGNQYPRHWVENIVMDTINQLRMKIQRKGFRYNAVVAVKQQENTEKQKFVLQYRGNISNDIVKKLNNIQPVQTILTTRKLKSCLSSLKSSFDWYLKSHVVYEVPCNGCKSLYVGQTCRHITTRVAEHAKADSPMGVHAIECNGDKTAFQWKILDQYSKQSKVMTLEELYIRTLKPVINTRDENWTRELTLKPLFGDENPT